MKFSPRTTGAVLTGIGAGLGSTILIGPLQLKIFYDLLSTGQSEREMTLVLGLILIRYADKTLGPL